MIVTTQKKMMTQVNMSGLSAEMINPRTRMGLEMILRNLMTKRTSLKVKKKRKS
jgi:hypothetical protein